MHAAENEAAAEDEAAAKDDAGTKHEAAAEEAWYSVSRMTVLRLTHLYTAEGPLKLKDIDVIHVIHVIHVARRRKRSCRGDEAAAEDDAGTKHAKMADCQANR